MMSCSSTSNNIKITINKIRLDQRIADLESSEKNIKNQFIETQNKEKNFVEKINEKYGDGNLDLNTGVFTPKTEE